MSLTQPLFRWGDIKSTIEIGKLQQLIAQKSYAEGYRDLATLLRSQALQIVLKKRSLQYRASFWRMLSAPMPPPPRR